jgi:hypothetical protein
MLRMAILVAAGLVLAGCAQPFMKLAQSQCAQFGFTAGSTEYAACVQSQYNQNLTRLRDGLAAAGGVLNPHGAGGGFAPRGEEGTRVFKNTYLSGAQRICLYDRSGVPETTAVDAADPCP